jgi:hypothetical protein
MPELFIELLPCLTVSQQNGVLCLPDEQKWGLAAAKDKNATNSINALFKATGLVSGR